MKKRLLSLLCAAFLLLPLLTSAPIHGADSTSFDPTKVEVKAKGAGIPVGMIFAWPVGKNPDDMDNWLECNGQSISQSVYPELFAVLGGQTPDLRGLFLRGHGGNSAALGVQQGDAIRNITGHYYPDVKTWSVGGAFANYAGAQSSGNWGGSGGSGFSFDASRVVPTAEENRPVNMAVRYFVRARP